MKNKLLYSLSNNPALTHEVATLLGIDVASNKVIHFADGEIMVENITHVRGKDVNFIQSTSNPVTQNLFEILVFVDGLKRASAKSITAIIPYFGYARQDRINKPQQPITARLVADLLTSAGVNHVIALDFHAGQVQGFFSCPVDDLSASSLFAKYYEHKIDAKNTVIVSPDHGGATRARDLAKKLNVDHVAMIDKHRDSNHKIDYMKLIGDVKGKNAIIIDDIIDTASTLVHAAKTLRENGALSVVVCATHGVFSLDSLSMIENSNIQEVVITNSIEHKNLPSKIKVISIASLLAQAIVSN